MTELIAALLFWMGVLDEAPPHVFTGTRAAPAYHEMLSAEMIPGSQCEYIGKFVWAPVVICPPNVGEQEWRRAGQAACFWPGQPRRPCNAWIWDDPAKAPSKPASFANPMTDAQLDSTVAVWINKMQTLKICARDGC